MKVFVTLTVTLKNHEDADCAVDYIALLQLPLFCNAHMLINSSY